MTHEVRDLDEHIVRSILESCQDGSFDPSADQGDGLHAHGEPPRHAAQQAVSAGTPQD